MYLFFFSLLDTLFLVHWSYDHLVIANIVFILDIYIFDDVVYHIFTYLSMCCFFSPFIHMFLILLYAIFYFCFTLRYLDEFCLKCFRKTSCQNLSCHELSSCKFFQEFMLWLDFIVFNKWVWVEWFMTSLIFHLVVVVLSRIAKGRDF